MCLLHILLKKKQLKKYIKKKERERKTKTKGSLVVKIQATGTI
jgi:hypothetical protein